MDLVIKWTARDAMLQRHPIQILHDDEWPAILLPDFMNSADVGVIQDRDGLRLALESGKRLRISGNIIGQELERDKATQAGVFRFVDHTHPAAA